MASSIMRSIPLARRRAAATSLSLPAFFAIALVVTGLISLLYLAQTSAVATTGYDVKRLEDQQAQWQMKNAQLRVKIAQLQSLERVETEAKSRLKIGPPTKVLFVTVDLPAAFTDAQPISGPRAPSERSSATDSRRIEKVPSDSPWWGFLRGALGL